ncbi:MAG TPA: GNAT family N-acetyltransferase [Solimonas sp.]
MSEVCIRAAEPADVPVLLTLIRALAVYEKLEHEVIATEADLRTHLFGVRPYAEALIAECKGEAAGFALYFHNYSTFLAKPGLYLEDLFVQPAQRGKGIGKRLLAELAQIGIARGCGRFEWTVLDWNEPAIRFYQSLGAEMKREWIINRLSGNAFSALAAQASVR